MRRDPRLGQRVEGVGRAGRRPPTGAASVPVGQRLRPGAAARAQGQPRVQQLARRPASRTLWRRSPPGGSASSDARVGEPRDRALRDRAGGAAHREGAQERGPDGAPCQGAASAGRARRAVGPARGAARQRAGAAARRRDARAATGAPGGEAIRMRLRGLPAYASRREGHYARATAQRTQCGSASRRSLAISPARELAIRIA